MRIALFSDTYLPNVNGVANTLGRLVREANLRGDEVALITPRVSRASAEGTALHLQASGIPVPVYPELRLASPFFSGVDAAIHDFAPDIVHVATEATVGLMGRSWALRHRTPLVTSFHTNYADYARGYRMGMFERAIWRYLRWFHGAARLSFHPSQATRDMLREKGLHSRWRLWSRGVDTELFSPAHRREEIRREIAPGAETIVLFVGRIAPEKRCRVALDAYRAVRPSFPRTAFVFVGDGPDRRQLEALQIPGVRFLGYRRGRELAEIYATSDLLLFPSDTETFGNVVLEAFASGLPTIVADRGGVRDTVVPGETGFLCPPGDVTAFAAALARLLDDAELRLALGAMAREEALRRSWKRIFDRLFESYGMIAGVSPDRELSWTN